MQPLSQRAKRTKLGRLIRGTKCLALVAAAALLSSCSEDGAGLPASLTGGSGPEAGGTGGRVGAGGALGVGGFGTGGATGGDSASGGASGGVGGPGAGGISGIGGIPDVGGFGGDVVIDAWHGESVEVGGPDSFGVPQDFANVVGRISSPYEIVSASYQINAGAVQPLPLGPNNNRLSIRGDFNVEVPIDELAPHPATNRVRIHAVDEQGEQQVRDVSVVYRPLAKATSPSLSLDWSSLSDIGEVMERAALVDGQWELLSDGLHVVKMGYDRLIAVGDRGWSPGYEVVAKVTLHDFRMYGGLGIAIGWQGHGGSSSPRTDWPLQALGWVRFRPEGPKVQIMTFERNEIAEVATTMTAETEYVYRVRSSRLGGGVARFSVKCWPASAPEPSAFQLEREVDERAGSVLLVAHHADVTWTTLKVTPTN